MRLLTTLVYRIGGESCLSYLKRLEKELFCTTEEQLKRLGDHLLYCRDKVPMYRCLTLDTEDPLGSLKRVPIFDKAGCSCELEHVKCSSFRGKCLVDSTSGTSGQSFRFLVSREELAIRKAYEIVANRMLGLEPGERFLQIWGGHELGSVGIRVKTRLYDVLSNRTLITVRGTDRKSLAKCADFLYRHKGGVLMTYPGILYGICESLRMSEVLREYKSIILTGEAVCYEDFVRFGLSGNLRNRYGSREFGTIALADVGAMRYFQTRFVLEVDESAGLLVTDLCKKVMPMLRYPIGDFIDPNVSGSNISRDIDGLAHLGKVQGRVFDTLEGRDGTVYAGTFWTHLWRDLIRAEKFKLKLHDSYQLEVEYVGTACPDAVATILTKELGANFDINVMRRESIPELKNAKQKIVERVTQSV